MSFWRKKDKDKTKDKQSEENKSSKTKKVKIVDIFEACQRGELAVVEKLLRKGKANVNDINDKGKYPIHVAAEAGHIDIVEALLNAGAQCNMIENTEARWNVLHAAVHSKNPEMVHFLVSLPSIKADFRGPPTGTSTMDRNTPLHYFCDFFSENYENIIGLMIQKGANVNAANIHGETPLHNACRSGHIEIVKSLLSYGANPSAQNENGETPLHFSVRRGPTVIIKMLLEKGADRNISGAHGKASDVALTQEWRQLVQPLSKPKLGTTSTPLSSIKLTSSSTSEASEIDSPIPHFHWAVDFSEIKLGPKIGSGGFGEVFKGSWRGIDVAVKRIIKNEEFVGENLANFLHEITIMSKLRHQNILLFVGACFQEPNICFLTEYIPHGSLRSVLAKERLPPLKRINMAIEATRGLIYLHSQVPPVLHRDLKSDNLLVDDNYHIKLADFGLSRPVHSSGAVDSKTPKNRDGASKDNNHEGASTSEPNQNSENPPAKQPADSSSSNAPRPILTVPPEEEGGTLYIMAPEVLHHQPYTEKSDIYSLGMIFWELATEKVPYEGLAPLEILRAIEEESLPIPTELGSAFAALIKDCLSKNPDNRPTLEQVAEKLKSCKSQLSSQR